MSNVVPDGWSEDVIGSYIADSVAGEWGSEADGGDDDIPVLRATNFSESGAVDYRKLAIRSVVEKKRLKKSLQRGDIVLEKSGGSPTQPVGRVIYFDNDQPFLYSNFTQKLTPVSGCDSKYLFYKLYFEYQNGTVLKFQQQTTGIINFQLAEYLLFKSVFPPLPEQQKIAATLSSVDDVIEKVKAQIDKLKDLKTGIMLELLTKGIGHREFKDSPVGLIPVGWDCLKMSSIAKVTDGAHHTPTYTASGVPFLRVTDLKNKKVFEGNIKYVSEEEHQELIKRCKPEKGDILYSKNGTIGIPRLIDWDDEFSIFVSLALIKIHSDRVLPSFLSLFMDSPIVREQIRTRSKQGTVTNLHLEEIRDFDIPLPNLNEQERIADSLGSIIDKLTLVEGKLQTYLNIKKALMQDLLTGKVRVKVDT